MIYLVTTQKELFSNELYQIVTVEESLRLLEPLKLVGLDTETSGLDPYTCILKIMQLGCKNFQVVIDCSTISPLLYKEYLESDRLFLGWNLKFDLKFLFRQGIIPKYVYDGYLAEKLMWLGYPAGTHSLSLKTAGETYCNIELDKSVRGKIIWAGLTNDVIEYSANDVKYLEDIRTSQLELLKDKGLDKAIEYENRFVLPLAYCEYCGIKLDEARWKAKMVNDLEKEREAKLACDKWLVENEPNNPYVQVNTQGDLFTGYDLAPKSTLNWRSDKQVKPIFKKYGLDLLVKDKEHGGMKESIEIKVLKPQADKCSLVPIYIKFKEAAKVVDSFGQNFLDQINPVSKRIHTNYQQMGADTTRITSGGKDKANNTEYVNLLNLPADEETRACFCAEPGNKWISIDYSGQETYLMASIANDEAIIEELTNGSGDIHSLTAYMSYSEIPRDTPIKDIKKLYHNLRQEAKGIEFAINYGGDANTIAQNKGIPIDQATQIYNNYMSGFKGLKRYQDFRRKDWFNKGYILLNPLTGHKAYIYDYNELLEDKKWMDESLDWDYYRSLKLSDPSCDTVKRVRQFFKRKSASEKQSINYPIQASGSMCLRLSLIYFFEYLRANNLLFKVLLCVTPYDEINCEAPEEVAETVAKVLYDCMVKAGAYFCTRCKLDADVSRNPDGTLPTHWVH